MGSHCQVTESGQSTALVLFFPGPVRLGSGPKAGLWCVCRESALIPEKCM